MRCNGKAMFKTARVKQRLTQFFKEQSYQARPWLQNNANKNPTVKDKFKNKPQVLAGLGVCKGLGSLECLDIPTQPCGPYLQ